MKFLRSTVAIALLTAAAFAGKQEGPMQDLSCERAMSGERNIRRIPVVAGKESLLREKLDEINSRQEEVLGTLEHEGCLSHRMFLEREGNQLFLVVERWDTAPVRQTFAEREAATGNRLYSLLASLVSECLDVGKSSSLPAEAPFPGTPVTDFSR
ncbi:antibiotic biosynthesis monooxygenase [bacterium]|nr:antibiotic biosynthesis monooxygenase [bacterium]